MVGIIKLLSIRRLRTDCMQGQDQSLEAHQRFSAGIRSHPRFFGGFIKETSNFEDNRTKRIQKFVNTSGN